MDVSHNDSGYMSHSSERRRLSFSEEWWSPTTALAMRPNRKRKISNVENDASPILSVPKLNESVSSPSADSSDDTFYSCFGSSSILAGDDSASVSSLCSFDNIPRALEESKLSTSLEKVSITDILNETDSIKRPRLDDSSKSHSAPNTPTHEFDDDNVYLKKCHSLYFTPSSPEQIKIGTPEKNQLLYPQLKELKPYRIKSPEKLRRELSRISKPKKCLFGCKDFVYLFTKKGNYRTIISRILSYLDDPDLVNVAKVSRVWKEGLLNDNVARERYYRYTKELVNLKENIFLSPYVPQMLHQRNAEVPDNKYTAVSPARANWLKFTTLAMNLAPDQSLRKCPDCSNPAIVENNIGKCSKPSCGYVWCLKCMSYTTNGENTFVDTCQNTPPQINRLLNDISNSFFMETTSRDESSGYGSMQSTHNETKSPEEKQKISVLGDYNREVKQNPLVLCSPPVTVSRPTLSVVHGSGYEPPSPPRVKKQIVGSKDSKKRLKRLCY